MTTVAHISRECEKENTIAPSSDSIQALGKLSQAGVSRMMVVDGERLVGLLSLSDLMKFIALKMELEDVDGARSGQLPSLYRVDSVDQSLPPNTKGSKGRVVETH